ncbi:hypothetical protein [Streptomyces adustus]|uniref:hypothetical protein n=1 Tax=Streptomyces adustus TaxID=1609272 RepID=UPI00192E7588|nr:hypothetical protein [Streptomyces adustus]
MPHDPYAVLRALLRAEAARNTPKPEAEKAREARRTRETRRVSEGEPPQPCP